MTNFSSQAISAVLQIAVFLLIPFIWWLATARKTQSFFGWLGWTRPVVAQPAKLAMIIAGTIILFTGLGVVFIPYIDQTARSPLTGLGFAGLGAAIVYAVAQTAFAEESLFRGFILKRVAARFGFWAGNIVQAVLFGLAHMVPLFLLGTPLLVSIGTFFYSGLLGLIMGWFNERMAGGSIVPGWILHAIANLLSAFITLFILV